MDAAEQKSKAIRFRALHTDPPILVLPNVWDAASARVIEQAGFPAIATTSSGVAAALGYPDGQHISREMLVEATVRITKVVHCPVSVDSEAGYGSTIGEVLETVRSIIEAGAVGINIEDTTRGPQRHLVDIAYQVELIQALRHLAISLDIPLVINARTDVFLLPGGDPDACFTQAVQRANAYLQAGADCAFPIGVKGTETIGRLVQAIGGPVNVAAGFTLLSVPELAQLGVARVSFASWVMRAVLGHLRVIAHELLEHGTYGSLTREMLSGPEFSNLW
jgi:2-methylisocitrate lyase-like PEP mutase family enzyme